MLNRWTASVGVNGLTRDLLLHTPYYLIFQSTEIHIEREKKDGLYITEKLNPSIISDLGNLV
jgi:hypothetical protein